MTPRSLRLLGLGSTENARVARAVRALGVYSEIHNFDITKDELAALPNLKGIILNGGPNNVVDGKPVEVGEWVRNAGVPVFAIQHGNTYGCVRALAEIPGDDEILKAELRPFLFEACKAAPGWNMNDFIADQVARIRAQVGDGKVLLALSGGVDSSVVAALLIRAIGNQLYCVHVNHGLMRKGESEQVVAVFRDELKANLTYIDATDRFLDKLAGVADPEQKRKIIGTEFIRVFEEEGRKLKGIS
ncbi:MAG: glutamine-hydrolyzing GMP synthase, partial [Clostridia bacterium]|nr:glutamine-hydrolyzing GMP synthase [Clostridia bacterium]